MNISEFTSFESIAKVKSNIRGLPLAEHPCEIAVVDFDGPDDAANPVNWPSSYKWSIVGVISIMSLVVWVSLSLHLSNCLKLTRIYDSNLAILMCAPATPRILEEFHSQSQLEATILISVWELGEVVGPLIVGPLSEVYGRLPVYHTANVLFIVFSIVAAESRNINMLIACRFLLGLSVASTTLNPCIVGDLFEPESRGRAIAVMGMTPFIAPILGPIIGGLISQAKGWRWTFRFTTIITVAFELCFLIVYRESYQPTILERKARRLREETGNKRLQSKFHRAISARTLLGQSIIRPAKLLFLSPVLLLISICGAFASSYTYIIITTMTGVFEKDYGFSERSVGLTYLGLANSILGLGMISSVVLCGTFLDYYLKRKARAGNPKPEYRLPPMALGSILVPLGLIAFGWSVQAHAHWIVPIGSTALVGFGFVAVSLAASSYLIDAFGIYAASATAAATVLRNVASAVLPLAGPPLYAKLRLGIGNTILGSIALVFAAPVPLLLMGCGEWMRGGRKSITSLQIK